MRRLALALVVLLAGCASDPTEVVLVVDGEFVTPTEVDSIDVSVTAPNGDVRTATITFDATSPGFPRTLGIVQGSGGAGSYVVTVTAKLGTATVVSRKASFVFTSGQIRMLRIDLLRACSTVVCTGADRTCGEGGLCERIAVTTDPWHGTPPTQFDAGMSVGPLLAP